MQDLRWPRALVGLAALAAAVGYLAVAGVDARVVGDARGAAAASPGPLVAALAGYAGAFALRAAVWSRVLPGLPYGQAWSAVHVALAGNHVLPCRLGEVLRVTSVLRRTALPAGPVAASAVLLRLADLATVLALAAVAAPAVLPAVAGGWLVPVALALAAACAAGLAWVARLRRRGAALRLPGAGVLAVTAAAWLLESGVVWAAAHAAGLPLGAGEAVAVTAVTIAAQTVAVTPGGIGSYEAAMTAALVGLGAPAGPALTAAVVAHATKTLYALLTGAVALVVPAPSYVGRLRLARRLPPRPARGTVAADAPVVALLPAHDEEATVGAVVAALPAQVCGRRLVALVVDDGSTDATAERARASGATVVTVWPNRGLGAAVRTGLAAAGSLGPAAVVYLDADGEYPPSHVERLAEVVLSGHADYVVGTRFGGESRRMRPHRTVGNRVLTQWVRWLTRRRDLTDGQSGMRAFSAEAAAAAEIVHDYNYAQVLTLDLLGKGFAYAEVPIPYAFRTSGRSFVRLGRYLASVVPAVHRELNPPRRATAQSSTTWPANRSRAADQDGASHPPPAPSAAAAS